MADIDIERFEPTPDPELICPICHSVLHKPYETPCQHVFCKECIITWIRRGRGAFADRGNKCPSCRDYVYHDELKPALTVLCNLVNKMKVKCINQGAGCKEIISKEYLEAHEKDCEYQEVACKNAGCLVKSLKRDYQKHIDTCTMRLVWCSKDCQLRMPHYKLRNHSCLTELKQELKERYLEVAVMREIIETRVPVVSTSLRSEINWVSGDVSFNRAMMVSNYREENQTLRNTERQMLDKLVSGVDPRTLPAPPQNDNGYHIDSDRSPATTDEPYRSPAYSIQSPSDHGTTPVYVPGPVDDSPESPPYYDQYDPYQNYDDNDNYISDDHRSNNSSVSEYADPDAGNSDVDIMSQDEGSHDNSDAGTDDNRSHDTSDDDDDDDNDNDESGDHSRDHGSDDAGSDGDNSNGDDSHYGDGGDDYDEQEDHDRYSDNYSPDEHSDDGGDDDGSDQHPPSNTDVSDDGSDGSYHRHFSKRSTPLLLESDTDPLECDTANTSHDDSFQVSSTVSSESEDTVRSPFSTRREPTVDDDESMNEQLRRPTSNEDRRNISPHHSSSDDDDDNDDDDDHDDCNNGDEDFDNEYDNNCSENSHSASSDTTGHVSDGDDDPIRIKQEPEDKIQIDLSSDEEDEGNSATDDKKRRDIKHECSSGSESDSSESVINVSDDDDDNDVVAGSSQRKGKRVSGEASKVNKLVEKKRSGKGSHGSKDVSLNMKQEQVIDVNGSSSDEDSDSDKATESSDEDIKPGTLNLKRPLSVSSDESDDSQPQRNSVEVKSENAHITSIKDSPSSPDETDDDDDLPERRKTASQNHRVLENGVCHVNHGTDYSPESHFSEGCFEPDYTEPESGEEDLRISKKHKVKVGRSQNSSPKHSTAQKNGSRKRIKAEKTHEENKSALSRSVEVPQKRQCSVNDCDIPDCLPQENISQKLAKDISMLIKKTSGVKRTMTSPPVKGEAKKRKVASIPIKSPQ